jgi:uncharacterized protein with ATP-grasp and redox domains
MKQNLKNVIDFTIMTHNAAITNKTEEGQARAGAYRNVLNEFNAELQPYRGDRDPILFDENTGKARLDLIVFNNLTDWRDTNGHHAE